MAKCFYCNAETELEYLDKPVCASCMQREWEQLRAKNQSTLIKFLITDIELAFTLLESSKLASQEKHMAHARSALEKARTALTAVRRISRHIEDPEAAEQVGERINQLAQAIGLASSSISE